MENRHKIAYRYLLYQAMLDIRGLEGLSARSDQPAEQVTRHVNEAGAIAYWLHNIALASAHEFVSFSESGFWSQHTVLAQRYPGSVDHYRSLFDRIVAENGDREGATQSATMKAPVSTQESR